MPNENRHAQASYALLEQAWGTDSIVSAAIHDFVLQSSPSYTIKSRKFSLLKLLKMKIDPVVYAWLRKSLFRPTWKFSELILGPHGSAVQILENLQRHGTQGDQRLSIEFERTCSCLIGLLYFCGDHPSINIKVVLTEPKDKRSFDENNVRLGKGIEHGARVANKPSKIHSCLNSVRKQLKVDGFCISCGQPTLSTEERDRLITNKSVGKSIKDALRSGIQYTNKDRGSLEYCFIHAEGIAGSAAGHKARYWQIPFWSLLYAMTRKGVAHQLNLLFPLSFNLDFARLAMQHKACQIHIRRIEQNLNLILSGHESHDKKEIKAIVFHINKMFFEKLKLTPNPSTPTFPPGTLKP